MPCYVYRCQKCGKSIEKIEPYSASTIQPCSDCLEPEGLVRELSVSNFSMSGSGWYRDNYAKRA